MNAISGHAQMQNLGSGSSGRDHTGRGPPERRNSPVCVCSVPRSKKSMMCMECGLLVAKARIRMTCPAHPHVVYYSDLAKCPGCAGCAKECLFTVD